MAVAKSQTDIVKALLDDKRIDVNLMEGGGMTPLHLALSCGNKELSKMLLDDSRLDKEAKINGLTPKEFVKTMEGLNQELNDLFP